MWSELGQAAERNDRKLCMEWTTNNYLRRYGSGIEFKVEIDPPKDKFSNYHTISLELAEKIYNQKQGKIYVMYSGGVDSEYILNLFLSLKIEVTPVIVKLKPNYNEHDIKYALEFCESKKLNPLLIDIDFDNFVKSGKIVSIAEEYQIGAYQFPATFSSLLKLDGTVVMGNHGPPHMSKDPNTDQWYVDEIEPYFAILKFFEKNKIYGCPFFLVNTAEQYLSFLKDPVMVALSENKFKDKIGNNSVKWIVYNKISNFNQTLRKKYTGYENIESSEIFNHPNLTIFNDFKEKWWGKYSIPYTDMVKHLSGNEL